MSRALDQILACRPVPAEVLVHVDAGDEQTKAALEGKYEESVRWFTSDRTQGPGGGRNVLIREAQSPLVASFDDDSWPLDADYFRVAAELFAAHPEAAVLSAEEVRLSSQKSEVRSQKSECKTNLRPLASDLRPLAPDLRPPISGPSPFPVACFQNCAAVLRRDAFLSTRGYLPLRQAYGMEEADVALQLLDAGRSILHTPDLRVFHDTALEHHADAAVNAAHICNTALMAYLRYPVGYWPLGALQVFNRVRYAAGVGRWRGIARGLCQIPGALWRYRKERKPMRAATIALSRRLARAEVEVVIEGAASSRCAVECQ